MNQEIIDKLRRIYKETTNAVAKEGAKKKLQDAGIPLTDEKPKSETTKLNQETIDKLRRIYKETTNAVAKEGAKKKLQDAGVSLGDEKPKAEAKAKKPKAEAKAKKPKAQPKAKTEPKAKPTSTEEDDYCNELIAKEKERKAKAKANAQKRANEPKKTPATKNKERVEKATSKVEKNVETRAKKGEVKVTEIEKLIAEYEDAIKKLKALLVKVKSGKKFARGGNMGIMDYESASAFNKIKDHNCGCNDKMEHGGDVEGHKNKTYLSSISSDKKTQILQNIAKHYGISVKAAEDEVTDTDAEDIYEYIANDKQLQMSVYKEFTSKSKMARGGKVKERDTTIDREYRALKGGKRTSSKYASVEMRGGGVYHRRNANQYGKVKGGKTYTENRPNRTDAQPRKYLAKGGNIDDISNSIFSINEKKGKIKTSFGDKTLIGLKGMIENTSYNSTEIAEAIFHSNTKGDKILTTYGSKTIKGLTEMIEDARKYLERGGHVSKGEHVWKKLTTSEKMDLLYKNFTPSITPRSQEMLVSKSYKFLPKNVKIMIESKYADVE